jgi:hypothetical protein
MVIIILTISAYLVLAAHLPISAFSQLPFLPDSHTNANSSNHRSTTDSNNNNDNYKIPSSEGANLSSSNKLLTNASKPKLSTLQQIKGTQVTTTNNLSYKGADKFRINEIYPTKKSGREWYINMANPRTDPIFSLGSNQSIIKQNGSSDSSIVGRWIGWKTIVYNIDNDKAVKMESYLDDKNNNPWVRVTNLTDNGGWYADTSDKKFYSANCGRPKDYIVTNSGPMIYFRADNMILDFKDLSVREIEPPPPLSK